MTNPVGRPPRQFTFKEWDEKERERKEKRALEMREYRRENRERILAQRRELRKRPKDKKKHAKEEILRYYKGHEKNKDRKRELWAKNKARRVRYYEKYPGRQAVRDGKCRAKKRGLPFELTEAWYDEQIPKGCAVTGIPFDPARSDTPWVSHVDRIIPSKGYIMSNCRLVCACYNLAKKHWTDVDVQRMARGLLKNTV